MNAQEAPDAGGGRQNLGGGVLGFFRHGVPAVAARTDLIFMRNALKYLTDQSPLGELNSEEEFLKEYRFSIAVCHEVKHFHDALLADALFEEFIYASKRNLVAVQLFPKMVQVFSAGGAEAVEKARKDPKSELAILSRNLDMITNGFHERRKRALPGAATFGISTIMEASATCAEIGYLHYCGSRHLAETFYREHVYLGGEKIYSEVIEHYRTKEPDIMRAIDAVHYNASCALALDVDVEAGFQARTERFLKEGRYEEPELEVQIGEARRRTSELEGRLSRMRLESAHGDVIRETRADEVLATMSVLPMLMRRKIDMLNTWVSMELFVLPNYILHAGKMGIPPIIFTASDEQVASGMVYAIDKSEKPNIYTIASPAENENMVLAGIFDPGGYLPSGLGVVDMSLLNCYIFDKMMGEQGSVFGSLIDARYQTVLGKILSGEISAT